MAFKYLVYVNHRDNTVALCEGGVYTDDPEVLEQATYYRDHDYTKGEADVEFHNRFTDQMYGSYELRDWYECSLHELDMDVVSSLDKWQKDSLKVTFKPDAFGPAVVEPKRETVKDYFDKAFPNFVPKDLDRYHAMSMMTLDSGCGDDCKAAIDAGLALVDRVRTAHGEWPKGNEFVKQIGDIVTDICSVFING
jgi:hypothetical protein